MENIVIIGGGFAGLNLAKRLDSRKFRVMVVDRNNFHGFPPLFYQIASSGLAASNISFPFRREFKKRRNVSYHMGHVKGIDLAARTVTTSYETLSYDRLVIAAGATNNFFGMDELDKTVFCIKTVAEAAHTRDEILDRLERGAICKDPEQRRRLLSFLVVGGGPTGVEIAGALGEVKKYVVPKEYPELKPDDIKITLIEGTDRLLGPMSRKSQLTALHDLKNLLVDVRLNTMLKSYDNKTVTYADGTQEYCETLIWTAGIKGEPMPDLPAEMIGHGGRITVDEFNRISGHPEIMAIGDIALMETKDYPHGHPQVAQPAIQQARNLARNLNLGEWKYPFRYRDKGSMATIGKNRAVVDLRGGIFMKGFIAWLVWGFIHLISILGMRNKINVLLNWAWNYLTYSSSLRLLMRPTRWPLRRHWGD